MTASQAAQTEDGDIDIPALHDFYISHFGVLHTMEPPPPCDGVAGCRVVMEWPADGPTREQYRTLEKLRGRWHRDVMVPQF